MIIKGLLVKFLSWEEQLLNFQRKSGSCDISLERSLQGNDFDKNSFGLRWLFILSFKNSEPRRANLICPMKKVDLFSCATILQRSVEDNGFDKNIFDLG